MSLQSNDLRKLVSKKIHIDEYRSKMGDDADVIVINFKVKYYEPAVELTNFIEKGYEWVLDADTSSGEMEDGSYIVFVETLRRPTFPQHLIKLIDDLQNLTMQEPSEYLFKYHKAKEYRPLDIAAITQSVPLTPSKYRALNGETSPTKDKEPTEESVRRELESLQTAAGIPISRRTFLDRELKEFVNLSKVSHGR